MNQHEQFKCHWKAGIITRIFNTDEKSMDYDADENISKNSR